MACRVRLPKSVCQCREAICSARRKAFGRLVIVPRRSNMPPPGGRDDLPRSVCRCRETICSARRKAFGRPVIVPGRLNTPPPAGWWRPSKKCLAVSGDHFFSSTQGLWASRHCSRTVEHAARRVVTTFQEVFAGVGRPFVQFDARPLGVPSLLPDG